MRKKECDFCYWKKQRRPLPFFRAGVPNLQGLMPNELKWRWCNRNNVHSKCNALKSSWRHSPTPGPWKNGLPWNWSSCQKGWGPLQWARILSYIKLILTQCTFINPYSCTNVLQIRLFSSTKQYLKKWFFPLSWSAKACFSCVFFLNCQDLCSVTPVVEVTDFTYYSISKYFMICNVLRCKDKST